MTEQPRDPGAGPTPGPTAGPTPGPTPPSQQPPFHTPPPPGYRRLTRTADDAPISGVCGGVARYLGVDPTVVRVLAVIAAVVTFPVGPIVYAVMWAVMPKE